MVAHGISVSPQVPWIWGLRIGDWLFFSLKMMCSQEEDYHTNKHFKEFSAAVKALYALQPFGEKTIDERRTTHSTL